MNGSVPRSWKVAALVTLLLVGGLRAWLFLKSGVGLHVDEAQYWFWSQDLEWGYFSKPPVLSALVALSTWLFGHSALGVKFLTMLIWMGLSLAIWWVGRVMGQERVGFVAGVLMLGSTTSGLLGMSATTDAPLMLCWTLVMGFVWKASHTRGWASLWAWGWVGFWVGLAILSKYTAAVLALSALWLLWWVPARSRLVWFKGVLWAMLVATLTVAPHLWWNMQNHWPTLQHTLDITVGHAEPLAARSWTVRIASEVEFILGQLLLMGPAWWLATWKSRQPLKAARLTLRPTLNTGSLPSRRLWSELVFVNAFVWPLLAVGMVQAWNAKAQVNWVLPILIGLSLMLAWRFVRLQRTGTELAASFVLGVAFCTAISLGGDLRTHLNIPAQAGQSKWDFWMRMRDWPEAYATMKPALLPYQHLTWVTPERATWVMTAYELRDLQPTLRSWNPSGSMNHHFNWRFSYSSSSTDSQIIHIGEGAPDAQLASIFPKQELVTRFDRNRIHLQAWLLSK